jgi:hypothetical protein
MPSSQAVSQGAQSKIVGFASSTALRHLRLGDEMIRYGAILGLAAGLIILGDAEGQALLVVAPTIADPMENVPSLGAVGPGPGSIEPARSAAREHPPTGNPLWAVPLKSLSVTRERPIFSPSRRPPPPPVVAAAHAAPVKAPASKPTEPDQPLLSLVGTVVGESEGIGIFLDQATKGVIRLRTGQDHDGWILRSVQGREATFGKDQRTAILALPPPGAEPAGQPAIRPFTGTVAGDTWMDGDGQMISPPQPGALPPPAAAPVEDEVGAEPNVRPRRKAKPSAQ